MNQPPDASHLVRPLAEAVGLVIAPEHMPGVAENLRRLLIQARIVLDTELPPGIEPAPVFRP